MSSSPPIPGRGPIDRKLNNAESKQAQTNPTNSTKRPRAATMAKNSGIMLIGLLLGRVLNFLSQIVFSKMLGLQGFGTYTYCSTLLTFLAGICLGGFSQTTVRYISVARANNNPTDIKIVIKLAMLVIVVLTVIVSSSIFFFRDYIATNLIGKPEIIPYLVWIAIGLPGLVMLTWLGFALRAFREVAAEAMIRHMLPPLLLLLIIGVFVVFLNMTVTWAITALLLSIFLTTGIGFIRLIRHWPQRVKTGTPATSHKQLLKFAAGIWLTRFSGLVRNQSDRLLIGTLSSLSQVGIYHAAYRIADFQTLAMGSFVPMFSTVIAEAHAQKDNAAMIHYYRMVVRWSLLITLPICLLCWIFAEPIMSIFGTEFVKGVPVLMMIALASLIDSGVGPAGQFLQMIGREKLEMSFQSISAVLAIGLNIVLIPHYGSMGAAIGSSIAIVSLNAVRIATLRKFLGIFPYTKLTIKLLSVCITAGIMSWLTAPAGLSIQIIVLLTIYITGAILFCLHQDDRTMLLRFKNKISKR